MAASRGGASRRTTARTVKSGTADTSTTAFSAVPGVADTNQAEPDKLSAATRPDASGALVEPEILDRIDTAHPAVDDRPRERQPAVANRIDFNDPTISGAQAVENNLKAQA